MNLNPSSFLRTAIVVAVALLSTACSANVRVPVSKMSALSAICPTRLLPRKADEGFTRSLRILVSGSADTQFNAHLEVSNDLMTLVGFSQFGNRSFTLTLNRKELHYTPARFFDLPVPPDRLAQLIQFALWPEDHLKMLPDECAFRELLPEASGSATTRTVKSAETSSLRAWIFAAGASQTSIVRDPESDVLLFIETAD
jgi:hypothetical protein